MLTKGLVAWAGRSEDVLFVCYGNLCRSPYAAAALRRALEGMGLPARVTSAGFSASHRRPPAAAVAAAAVRGIDLGGHRSRRVDARMIRSAGWILVMEAWQRDALIGMFAAPSRRILLLGDLDSEPIESRAIPDPHRGTVEVFDAIYARIDRCVVVFAKALDRRRTYAARELPNEGQRIVNEPSVAVR